MSWASEEMIELANRALEEAKTETREVVSHGLTDEVTGCVLVDDQAHMYPSIPSIPSSA